MVGAFFSIGNFDEGLEREWCIESLTVRLFDPTSVTRHRKTAPVLIVVMLRLTSNSFAGTKPLISPSSIPTSTMSP